MNNETSAMWVEYFGPKYGPEVAASLDVIAAIPLRVFVDAIENSNRLLRLADFQPDQFQGGESFHLVDSTRDQLAKLWVIRKQLHNQPRCVSRPVVVDSPLSE